MWEPAEEPQRRRSAAAAFRPPALPPPFASVLGAGAATSSSGSNTGGSAAAAAAAGSPPPRGMSAADRLRRSAAFWSRAAVIYGAYKAAQLRAAALALAGHSPERLKAELWEPHHAWAGARMHALAVDLRGFYLKAGQFIGARPDFVPEPICRQLAALQDRVPPMPAERAAEVLRAELGVPDLSELFEWIDLETPLGSASISQVHKARLRRFSRAQLRAYGAARRGEARVVTLGAGESAWSVCNDAGVSLAELAAANPGVDLDALREGDALRVPAVLGLDAFHQQHQHGGGDGGDDGGEQQQKQHRRRLSFGRHGGGSGAAAELARAERRRRLEEAAEADGDGDGAAWRPSDSSSSETGGDVVDGLLVGGRARAAASADSSSNSSSNGGGFLGLGRLLSRLSGGGDGDGDNNGARGAERPITSAAAAAVAHAVAVGSVPASGLVAVKVQYPDALEVMAGDLVNLRSLGAFLSRTEIRFDLVSAVDELQRQIRLEFDFMREARVMDSIAAHLAPISARVAVPRSVPGLVTKRVMAMTFMEGTPLLQLADRVAHLPQWKRDKAARLVLARISEAYGRMILGEGLFQADGHPGNILVRPGGGIALLDYGQSKQLPAKERDALARLILALHRQDTAAIDAALAGLGVVTSRDDTAARREMAYGMFDTRGRVDPFSPDSPIKKTAIERFPPDLFFVLRVVQLLRGIAQGMGVTDFSSADQWAPLARDALRAEERRAKAAARGKGRRRGALPSLAAIASPLRLTA